MKRPRNPLFLRLLLVVGVLVGLSGVVLHMALPTRYERIELIPLFVGFGLALFCAYWMEPDRAERASHGVLTAGREIVESTVIFREGTRKDDVQVRVDKSVPVDDPTATPTTEVVVSKPTTGGE